MATNFAIAPPPKTVDGLLAVPIDISTIAVRLPVASQTVVGLRVGVPARARPGNTHRLDFVQRTSRGMIIGGVAVEVHVAPDDQPTDSGAATSVAT